jgi:hypothetical protein
MSKPSFSGGDFWVEFLWLQGLSSLPTYRPTENLDTVHSFLTAKTFLFSPRQRCQRQQDRLKRHNLNTHEFNSTCSIGLCYLIGYYSDRFEEKQRLELLSPHFSTELTAPQKYHHRHTKTIADEVAPLLRSDTLITLSPRLEALLYSMPAYILEASTRPICFTRELACLHTTLSTAYLFAAPITNDRIEYTNKPEAFLHIIFHLRSSRLGTSPESADLCLS